MSLNPTIRIVLVFALTSLCIFLYMHLIDSGWSRSASVLSAFGLLIGMVAIVYLAEVRQKKRK